MEFLHMDGVTAAFDIVTFLNNAKTYAIAILSALIGLMGAIALGWGAVKLVLRLLGDPQEAKRKHSWGAIGLLILVGGALIAAGAWGLIVSIGKAGAGTVERLGNGAIDIISSGASDVLYALPVG